MPILRPIRPFRYGFDHVDQLGELVSPATRGEPENRLEIGDVHPLNVRRLVRGDADPDDPAAPPFAYAARLLRRWKESGVLVREPRPAFYAYEQRVGDASYRGLVCLVRLGHGDAPRVRPHEQTSPTGAAEELGKQLRALRTQLSMVMGFVPDAEGALARFLDRPAPPWLTVEDGRGVVNRLWREQDPAVHLQLAEALREEIAVIADGHHRYHAATAYRDAESVHGPATRERPYDYAMMLLRPVDGGAASSLTHRVFERLAGAGSEALEAALTGPSFRVVADGDPSVLARVSGDEPRLFAVATPGRVRVLQRSEASLDDPAIRALPEVLRDVDASALKALVLDPVAAASAWDTPADSRSGKGFSPNQISAREIVARVYAGSPSAALVLRTASPAVVQRIAAAGEVLPPKSTKFRPKPVKGLLLSSLVSF